MTSSSTTTTPPPPSAKTTSTSSTMTTLLIIWLILEDPNQSLPLAAANVLLCCYPKLSPFAADISLHLQLIKVSIFNMYELMAELILSSHLPIKERGCAVIKSREKSERVEGQRA
ncbi:hypothetical protein CEY00_Acc02233 [Actinidia chinensis var. chinensis]|uniref:Uncharacterized protein n=1 Tax=Actinidia chinensis var. chinensis TaxID=1590841 RepID=A0A2R6RYD5_ACTCC|nr:hypothetical protein CEY00_Acc02233 [Actinidia chinensis var. chinensis]